MNTWQLNPTRRPNSKGVMIVNIAPSDIDYTHYMILL